LKQIRYDLPNSHNSPAVPDTEAILQKTGKGQNHCIIRIYHHEERSFQILIAHRLRIPYLSKFHKIAAQQKDSKGVQ
jgi:hypothetical protein